MISSAGHRDVGGEKIRQAAARLEGVEKASAKEFLRHVADRVHELETKTW